METSLNSKITIKRKVLSLISLFRSTLIDHLFPRASYSVSHSLGLQFYFQMFVKKTTSMFHAKLKLIIVSKCSCASHALFPLLICKSKSFFSLNITYKVLPEYYSSSKKFSFSFKVSGPPCIYCGFCVNFFTRTSSKPLGRF